DVPGTPLGSPNPPVWTSRAGFFNVAGSELPEAKLLATTSFFFGSTGFMISVAGVNVLVITSFFLGGWTGTGGSALAVSTGFGSTRGGSTFGGSGGAISLGGVRSSASTLGGGSAILGTSRR